LILELQPARFDLNQPRHKQFQRICSLQKLSSGIRVQIMADRMIIASAIAVPWELEASSLVRIADCTSNETAGVPGRLSCFALAQWMPGGGGRLSTNLKDSGIDQEGNFEAEQPVPEMQASNQGRSYDRTAL
jgi:hypothetical protein